MIDLPTNAADSVNSERHTNIATEGVGTMVPGGTAKGHGPAFAEQLWQAGQLRAYMHQAAQPDDVDRSHAYDTEVLVPSHPTINVPTWRVWLDDQVACMSAKAPSEAPAEHQAQTFEDKALDADPDAAGYASDKAWAQSAHDTTSAQGAFAAVTMAGDCVEPATVASIEAAEPARVLAHAASEPASPDAADSKVAVFASDFDPTRQAPAYPTKPDLGRQTPDAAAATTQANNDGLVQAAAPHSFFAATDDFRRSLTIKDPPWRNLAQDSIDVSQSESKKTGDLEGRNQALLSNTTASASGADAFADRLTDCIAKVGETQWLSAGDDVDVAQKSDLVDTIDSTSMSDKRMQTGPVPMRDRGAESVGMTPPKNADDLRLDRMVPSKPAAAHRSEAPFLHAQDATEASHSDDILAGEVARAGLMTPVLTASQSFQDDADETAGVDSHALNSSGGQAVEIRHGAMLHNLKASSPENDISKANTLPSPPLPQHDAAGTLALSRQKSSSAGRLSDELGDVADFSTQLGELTYFASTHPSSTERPSAVVGQPLDATNTEASAVAVSAPVSTPAKLSERLATQLSEGARRIQLRVAPEGLGTLDIAVHLNGTQVHLTVRGDHPELNRFLQEGMPDLHKNLQDKGLDLGNTNFYQSSEKHSANADSKDRQFTDSASARPSNSKISIRPSDVALRDGASQVINVLV